MSDIYFFPGPFVFFYTLHNHEEWKTKLLPEIHRDVKENSPLDEANSNVISSFSRKLPVLETEFFFNQIVVNPFKEGFKKSGLSPKPHSLRAESWYNYFNPGFFHGAHTHPGADFCGIYLLDLQEPNSTHFVNKGHATSGIYDKPLSTENTPEGTILIFSADLIHWVNPVKRPRITISFNIQCQYSYL